MIYSNGNLELHEMTAPRLPPAGSFTFSNREKLVVLIRFYSTVKHFLCIFYTSYNSKFACIIHDRMTAFDHPRKCCIGLLICGKVLTFGCGRIMDKNNCHMLFDTYLVKYSRLEMLSFHR